MTAPVLKRALQTWGGQAQMLMVVEEMSELTKEILKMSTAEKTTSRPLLKKPPMLRLCSSSLRKITASPTGLPFIRLKS